jgi:hypothetical protein
MALTKEHPGTTPAARVSLMSQDHPEEPCATRVSVNSCNSALRPPFFPPALKAGGEPVAHRLLVR